ncbi:hypothetical protein JCM10212_003915 [Sporobolomyces blumeae]
MRWYGPWPVEAPVPRQQADEARRTSTQGTNDDLHDDEGAVRSGSISRTPSPIYDRPVPTSDRASNPVPFLAICPAKPSSSSSPSNPSRGGRRTSWDAIGPSGTTSQGIRPDLLNRDPSEDERSLPRPFAPPLETGHRPLPRRRRSSVPHEDRPSPFSIHSHSSGGSGVTLAPASSSSSVEIPLSVAPSASELDSTCARARRQLEAQPRGLDRDERLGPSLSARAAPGNVDRLLVDSTSQSVVTPSSSQESNVLFLSQPFPPSVPSSVPDPSSRSNRDGSTSARGDSNRVQKTNALYAQASFSALPPVPDLPFHLDDPWFASASQTKRKEIQGRFVRSVMGGIEGDDGDEEERGRGERGLEDRIAGSAGRATSEDETHARGVTGHREDEGESSREESHGESQGSIESGSSGRTDAEDYATFGTDGIDRARTEEFPGRGALERPGVDDDEDDEGTVTEAATISSPPPPAQRSLRRDSEPLRKRFRTSNSTIFPDRDEPDDGQYRVARDGEDSQASTTGSSTSSSIDRAESLERERPRGEEAGSTTPTTTAVVDSQVDSQEETRMNFDRGWDDIERAF